jgi:hypothetical protein
MPGISSGDCTSCLFIGIDLIKFTEDLFKRLFDLLIKQMPLVRTPLPALKQMNGMGNDDFIRMLQMIAFSTCSLKEFTL